MKDTFKAIRFTEDGATITGEQGTEIIVPFADLPRVIAAMNHAIGDDQEQANERRASWPTRSMKFGAIR